MNDDLIKRSDAIGAFVAETNGVNVEKAIKVVDAYLQIRECDEVWDSIRAIRDCLECAKDDIAEFVPSADRPQGWIPCSERLPELTIHENEPFIGEWDNSEPVLIYHKDNKYEYPYLIAQYTNGFENNEVGWTEMEEANDVIDVVAWMPLPKPYEEVKENE